MSKKFGVLIALLASSGAIAATAAGPAAAAAKTTTCGIGNGEGEGYSYLLSLSATGTSCTTAKAVVKKRGAVKGWKCTKKILQKGKGTYYASETCTDKSLKIAYKFEQFT